MKKMSDYVDTNPPATDTPNGTFKNETQPNACDGTDIKAEQMQDPYYALYQILQLAGEIPNGELENSTSNKQFLKSLTNIGWFKYDSNTAYKKSAIVINTIEHTTKLYRSQIDNNTAPLTDSDCWINVLSINSDNTIELNTTSDNCGVFIGAFMYGIRADNPEGWLRCDGSEYTKSAFPTFWTNYLSIGKIPTCTYTEYSNEISNHGSCGKFAIDLVNLTFKVPMITGQTFIGQALASGDVAKFNKESLPNIKGNAGITSNKGIPYDTICNGAFKLGTDIGSKKYAADSSNNANSNLLGFDASGSCSVYKDGAIVQPNNIQYPIFVCVANIQIPVSEAQYNGFIDGLASKVNLDGSNATLNNLSETAKANLSNSLKNYIFNVNYSAGVSIGNGGTAPSAGIVKFCSTGGYNNDRRTGYINGVQVWQHWSGNNNNNGYMESTANIVKAGDVITYNGNSATFYPFATN